MTYPSNIKVALVTDSMTSFGGADRLLLSVLEIFPQSDIYTSVYNKKSYNIKNRVYASFIQHIPFFKRHLSFLYPFAFETFDLTSYDLVITLTAGPAKGVIIPHTIPHITIVLTPPRHQWDRELNARGSALKSLYRFASSLISHYLRIWDLSASKRMGRVVTISKYIQNRVKNIYGLSSEVVYPGVDKYWYETSRKNEIDEIREKYNLPTEFLFVVSRLYDHKRIDMPIRACIESKTHFYICGDGPDLKYLKKVAKGSKYIHFLGSLKDNEVRVFLHLCSCFVFPALEDFGYVTAEAQAQGKPVFCLNRGGSVEIVKDGESGRYFSDEKELYDLISKKRWVGYNPKEIRKNAQRFESSIFKRKIIELVDNEYKSKRA